MYTFVLVSIPDIWRLTLRLWWICSPAIHMGFKGNLSRGISRKIKVWVVYQYFIISPFDVGCYLTPSHQLTVVRGSNTSHSRLLQSHLSEWRPLSSSPLNSTQRHQTNWPSYSDLQPAITKPSSYSCFSVIFLTILPRFLFTKTG